MAKSIISGLAHCCHHDTHFEWCYDYQARVDYIKREKPVAEQELRLKLFQILPFDRLPLQLRRTLEAYNKAKETYMETRKSMTWKPSNEAWEASGEAREVLDKAREAYDKTLNNCMMKLHDELFPDCTWNEKQKTIFPIKGDK